MSFDYYYTDDTYTVFRVFVSSSLISYLLPLSPRLVKCAILSVSFYAEIFKRLLVFLSCVWQTE